MAARFSLDLPATVTFDYPTAAALAAFVHSQMPAPVEAGSSSGDATGAGSWQAAAADTHGNRVRRRQRFAGPPAGRSNGGGKQQRSAAVLQQLSEVVAGVLGVSVPPEQPLMEVRGP